MQDRDGLQVDHRIEREGSERGHGIAALERSIAGEWHPFRPGGEVSLERRLLGQGSDGPFARFRRSDPDAEPGVSARDARNEQSITAVSERAEQSINRVNAEMWRSIDPRLKRETERIAKEVERSVGAEMGRMYLRSSQASEGEVLRGRRR